MNTELVVTHVDESEHEIFMRTQLTTINERLIRIEDKVDKTHKVLDMAFGRFDAITKSPLLGSLFANMGGKKIEKNG